MHSSAGSSQERLMPAMVREPLPGEFGDSRLPWEREMTLGSSTLDQPGTSAVHALEDLLGPLRPQQPLRHVATHSLGPPAFSSTPGNLLGIGNEGEGNAFLEGIGLHEPHIGLDLQNQQVRFRRNEPLRPVAAHSLSPIAMSSTGASPVPAFSNTPGVRLGDSNGFLEGNEPRVSFDVQNQQVHFQANEPLRSAFRPASLDSPPLVAQPGLMPPSPQELPRPGNIWGPITPPPMVEMPTAPSNRQPMLHSPASLAPERSRSGPSPPSYQSQTPDHTAMSPLRVNCIGASNPIGVNYSSLLASNTVTTVRALPPFVAFWGVAIKIKYNICL